MLSTSVPERIQPADFPWPTSSDRIKAAYATGDPASALPLYREALAAAGQAPESCQAADAAAGTGTRLAEAGERLDAKLGAWQSTKPAPGGKSPGETPAGALQDRLDQLQDRSRQAGRERNSGREREEYLDSNDGSAPERPW
ncbi:hypothetical protein [Pseudarthrobacter enclensis]|uniref:Uncharacterized protein n=1 Tax=Pseudarthrobacter enclensis TaxID=993070 RepID=A0ABT9RRW9_9MICC|nr:hypothetical protein [Pseudarthrobacter enclensis]MDP9887983.1 hypothetical protein [Pseudarthrobacter enclensis]